MHWSLCLLLAGLTGLGESHGIHGLPKLVGGRNPAIHPSLQHFRDRVRAPPRPPHVRRHADPMEGRSGPIDARQNGGTSGRCGARYGSCATGYCCSIEGYCGKTLEACQAPDCQFNYGSGCDANTKPVGADTSNVARPKVGSVAYGGVGIYSCKVAGDLALTFDDGPYSYTGDLLDILAAYGAKATFFITGNNIGKGPINDPSKPWGDMIRRMHEDGHQIASHTWSHQNASAITSQQFRDQIIWNEIAFNNILGFFPTYMRPPYSICESQCQSTLATLGYHIIYFDLDTEGYLHADPNQIQVSKDIFDEAIDDSNPAKDKFLEIEHDIHYEVVYNLTDYILTGLFEAGYRSVTVGECLGDPKANWYRSGPSGPGVTTTRRSTSSTRAPTSTVRPPGTGTGTTTIRGPGGTPKPTQSSGPKIVSPDGRCGGQYTCLNSEYGNCCSRNNRCGYTSDYCGSGCQIAYGVCKNLLTGEIIQ